MDKDMFYLQWATIAEPSVHLETDALSTVSLKGKTYHCCEFKDKFPAFRVV